MKLTIDGVEYELTWGIGAHTLLCEMEQWTLQQMETAIFGGGADSHVSLLKLTYCALKNKALSKGETLPFNLFAFFSWFDEQPTSLAPEIIEDYKASKYMGVSIGEMYNIAPKKAEPEDKKKGKKASQKSTK